LSPRKSSSKAGLGLDNIDFLFYLKTVSALLSLFSLLQFFSDRIGIKVAQRRSMEMPQWKLIKTWVKIAAIFILLAISKTAVRANGIDRNGTSAESMAMGGADVGWANNPLDAMGDNPAGLGFLDMYEVDLGAVGGSVSGHFSKPSADSSGDPNQSIKALPEGAIGIPLGKIPMTTMPVSLGISFIPESMLLADWHYQDPPGGLGGATSYGYQEDKSEILVLRTAVGLGVQITPQLSVGASLGAVYNKNELVTPYTFQNLNGADAGFNGAKTLLDLNTAGWGWYGQVGAIYRPITNLQFGLSYQNQYTVRTTGSASGNAGAQFGSPGNPVYNFNYNAEVDNTFPQEVSLGSSWKFLPKWRASAEVDWIDWKDAFNTLPVKLSNGSGAVTAPPPAGLGTSLQDNIPLNWKSEFVYRVGLEYEVVNNLFLRGGYCYGDNPVPGSTLTPMTAAITKNTLTAGIGYRWQAWKTVCETDLAYQHDFSVTENVQTSGLLSGEYSNSSTRVAINWLAVTMSVKF
jgi:long-subunit fatty acid transport protein